MKALGKQPRLAGVTARVVLAVLCLLWLVPTGGIVVTSFRTPDAANNSGWWTVVTSLTQLTLANYGQVWSTEMGRSVVNSFVVAVLAVVLQLLFAGFAAYVLTFARFRGRSVLFAFIVSLLVVPMLATFVPCYASTSTST